MNNWMKMTVKIFLIVMMPKFVKMGRGGHYTMLIGVKNFKKCSMIPPIELSTKE